MAATTTAAGIAPVCRLGDARSHAIPRSSSASIGSQREEQVHPRNSVLTFENNGDPVGAAAAGRPTQLTEHRLVDARYL